MLILTLLARPVLPHRISRQMAILINGGSSRK